MLVLTRRVGEAIVIGNGMVVRVLEVRGDQVRIGVDAPRSVPVHREEVYREVARTNTDAAASAARTAALLRKRGRIGSPGTSRGDDEGSGSGSGSSSKS